MNTVRIRQGGGSSIRERRNGDGVMRMLMLMKDRPGGIRDDNESNTA